MTDKAITRNTLIFAAIIIVALLLWAYFRREANVTPADAAASQVQGTGGPSFVIQGEPTSYGNVYFPQAVYNIPASPPNGVYNPGSCECGCQGGVSGSTTYSFPDLTGYYTSLQLANDASLASSLLSITNQLPYDLQVFVQNATPTPWA